MKIDVLATGEIKLTAESSEEAAEILRLASHPSMAEKRLSFSRSDEPIQVIKITPSGR